MQIIGIVAGSSLAGAALYHLVWSYRLKRIKSGAEIEAKTIISEAQLEAKRIKDSEDFEIRKKADLLETKVLEMEKLSASLTEKKKQIEQSDCQLSERKKEVEKELMEIESLRKSYLAKLEEHVSIPKEAIKDELREQIEIDAKKELNLLKKELLEKTETELEAEARDMLLTAMQRLSSNPATEATATIVDLPSEDMKGRIIGREGRNIRSFEAVTGTTLMIDETPDSVLISAFDPVKREIARATLEHLLKDGRIHPSTIEIAYDDAKSKVLKDVQSLGEEAIMKLKLTPPSKEILELVGKLHFRLSLNQNSLEHSIEVAFIASMLASEIGLDPSIAKRAALFHDLGKAMDHEFEGSHAEVAAKFLERYDEDWRVVNAVAASHEEVPAESAYAPLITIADRISAIRPGARSDSMDSYVERVKSLEKIAKQHDGVKDAFALQAGREIRVIVEPTKLSDEEARKLATKISREIEDSMHYPSTIKITVIREQRFCETAK